MSTMMAHTRSRRPTTTRRSSSTTNHRARAVATNGGAPAVVAVPDHEIAGGFASSFTTSALQAQRFAQGVLAEASPIAMRAGRARLMVQWASLSGTPAQRQTLVKAYRAAGLELVLIQQMSELPRVQTAAFMKDYFAAGGAIGAIGDWLALAGGALRRPTVARPASRGNGKVAGKALFGGLLDEVGGWIKDTASKAGDAFVDAVGSVVDAVVSAGKSLGDAISSAVSWTVDQCTDLVE